MSVVAAVSTLALAACSGGSSSGDVGGCEGERDEYGVLLCYAGDEDGRLILPAGYEAGQSATATAQFTTALDVTTVYADSVDAELTAQVVMTDQVTDVTDGVATVETRLDEFRLVEANPAEVGAEVMVEINPAVGQDITFRYDEQGRQIDEAEVDGVVLTGTISDLLAGESELVGFFPREPIGTGARWSVVHEMPLGAYDYPIQVETLYELVELSPEGFSVELTQDVRIDQAVQDTSMRGTLSGEGRIQGSLDSPLAAAYEFEQSGELFTTSSDGEATTWHQEVSMTQTSQ